MAIPNDQLFLDRFIEFNVERYKDNPSFVQLLQGLTLDKVTLSNFRETTLESGQKAHIYDIDYPGVFTGKNQLFYPADYILHNVAIFEEKEVDTLDDLEHKGTAGIYTVKTLGGRVLVLNGKKDTATVTALVKEKCLYVLTDNEITVSPDVSGVGITSPTILGSIGIVESLYDDIPRYNGQYRYDGTISYR